MKKKLSPIIIHRVRYGSGLYLRFNKPLVIQPTFNQRTGVFSAKKQSLGINEYTKTKSKLVKGLRACIVMLWECYALESGSKLTSSGMSLKERWIEAIKIPKTSGELLGLAGQIPAIEDRKTYNRIRRITDRMVLLAKPNQPQENYLDYLLTLMGEFEMDNEPIRKLAR